MRRLAAPLGAAPLTLWLPARPHPRTAAPAAVTVRAGATPLLAWAHAPVYPARLVGGFLCPNPAVARRFRGKDAGQTLKFDERKDRRVRKSADERDELHRKQDEAEEFARSGYPRELDDLFEGFFLKAQQAKLRLFNPAAAIEQIKVQVPPHPPRPLPQLGSIVKPNARELHIVPHQAANAGAIVNRLAKEFPELSAAKDAKTGRVVCKTDPVTRERRAIVAEEVAEQRRSYLKAILKLRQRGMDHLDGAGISDRNLVRQLHQQVEDHTKEAAELRTIEFEELEQSVFDDVAAAEDVEADPLAEAPPTPGPEEPVK